MDGHAADLLASWKVILDMGGGPIILPTTQFIKHTRRERKTERENEMEHA